MKTAKIKEVLFFTVGLPFIFGSIFYLGSSLSSRKSFIDAIISKESLMISLFATIPFFLICTWIYIIVKKELKR